MGSGVSTKNANLAANNIMIDFELVKASGMLLIHENNIKKFTGFIKGGTWIQKLSKKSPPTIPKPHRLNDPLLEYCTGDKSILKNLLTGERSIMKSSSEKYSRALEGYQDIESHMCFSTNQLMAMMFAILLPLHCSKKRYEIENESEAESSSEYSYGHEDYDLRGSGSCVGLLHSVAAYYDEMELIEELKRDNWRNNIVDAINFCPLAIAICDAQSRDFPIVYCNNTFSSKFSRDKYPLGENIEKIINSNACTSLSDVGNKLRGGIPAKVAIKKSSSGIRKQEWVELVALRPVFCFENNDSSAKESSKTHYYTVSVHYLPERDGSKKDLEVIDILLALLESLCTKWELNSNSSNKNIFSMNNEKLQNSSIKSSSTSNKTSSTYASRSASISSK